MQAVPTSVVVGPDRQYYVSQLTGFPSHLAAPVYRVNPRTGAVTVVASGFTNIMDLAFGRTARCTCSRSTTTGCWEGPPTAGCCRVPGRDEATDRPGPRDAHHARRHTVGRDGLYVTNNAGSQAADRCCASGRADAIYRPAGFALARRRWRKVSRALDVRRHVWLGSCKVSCDPAAMMHSADRPGTGGQASRSTPPAGTTCAHGSSAKAQAAARARHAWMHSAGHRAVGAWAVAC
jgi:ribosomal protein S14